jgi:hypothetical protein
MGETYIFWANLTPFSPHEFHLVRLLHHQVAVAWPLVFYLFAAAVRHSL